MSSKKLRDVREEVAGCQTPLPAGGTRYSPYANLNLKIISHPSESDGCELHLKISMCLHHHHAGISSTRGAGKCPGFCLVGTLSIATRQAETTSGAKLWPSTAPPMGSRESQRGWDNASLESRGCSVGFLRIVCADAFYNMPNKKLGCLLRALVFPKPKR